jgi:hypothetical protein
MAMVFGGAAALKAVCEVLEAAPDTRSYLVRVHDAASSQPAASHTTAATTQ